MVVVGVNRYQDAEPGRARAAPSRPGRRAAAGRAHAGVAGRAATPDEAAARLADVRAAAVASDVNLLEPMRAALAARCTIGEICEVLREEWGTYDALIAGGR